MTAVLEIKNVSKYYDGEAALDGFSLVLSDNEYMSLLGPSGSGKSTLLKVICGFEQLDSGDIFLNGKSITHAPAHQRGIGFVSQGFALFPHMSVFDNVAFGLRYREKEAISDEKIIQSRVDEILELVGLNQLGGRKISEISGGQKQRVALARTLIAGPKVILLDEPLGALDSNLRTRMRVELRRIRETLGISFIHVTGNEHEALAMGDRVAVLDKGQLAQISDSETLYNNPASARVAGFLSCYNMLSGRVIGDNLFQSISGTLACSRTSKSDCDSVYCIRFDQIIIASIEKGLIPGETGVKATYVTNEYSGPTISYFFKMENNQIFEVEYHLSHSRPESLVTDSDYFLIWKANDAQVFKREP